MPMPLASMASLNRSSLSRSAVSILACSRPLLDIIWGSSAWRYEVTCA